jgi:hypothetical protein
MRDVSGLYTYTYDGLSQMGAEKVSGTNGTS